MEHEIDKIITCEYNNKTITLKVTPIRDSTCLGCFFYQNYKSCCYNMNEWLEKITLRYQEVIIKL